MNDIPVAEHSQAEELISKLNWEHRPAGSDQIAIKTCPFCGNDNYKFYIGTSNALWDCKVCSKSGNYYQLRSHVMAGRGDAVLSMKSSGQSKGEQHPLPNFDAAYARLLSEDGGDVLDYLLFDRKWTMSVVHKMKLGCWEKGNKKWLVMPYFDGNGKPVYYKARSIPPDKKAFDSPAGYEAPLFNVGALQKGMPEVICAEGEPDTLALLSHGFDHVVGIPGAGVKKSTWVDLFDALESKRIIILYDRDKPGQEGAHALATKLGLHKCYNVLLPEFSLPDGTPGKDVNDWFRAGRTADELRAIIAQAKKFDVAGVQSAIDVMHELASDLEDHGVEPKYLTPWPSLTKRLGGFEDGDLVGVVGEEKSGKTGLVLNWLQYYAMQGHVCLNYCLEMPPKRLVRKWVSHVSQTDDTPGRSEMTPEVVRSSIEFAGTMPGDMLFGYTRDKDPKAVFDTIRQAVRRYGVKIVALDHLHLLCRSIEHQSQEIAKLSVDCKSLAMELGIVMILIVQPNRVAEGQIVGARNVLGSSMVGKLVDSMVCIHRNRVAQIRQSDFRGPMETDDNLEPHMLVRVDLCRYAPGGMTTLHMDGARSTVRELGEEDVVSAVRKPVGEIPVEVSPEI
jgi:KaiC/GvpD/RAD55 family RecA-like ATPase